jgi:hypothetical protein
MKAAMAYFSAFVDGRLDSLWTHAILVGVIAIAELALAIGIWLESPKNKVLREWFGLGLVLGGCVISVIATIGLLIFDEGISRRQNDEIIAMQARPWTEEQFDAIQEIKGKVTDVGIFPEKGCIECRLLANHIELALHVAGVQLYGDESIDWTSGTGVMVYLPDKEAAAGFMTDPLVAALHKAGLSPGVVRHNPPEWSPVRTDIRVIFVGEKFPQLPDFPYSPKVGATQWSELPLRNPSFAPATAANPANASPRQ